MIPTGTCSPFPLCIEFRLVMRQLYGVHIDDTMFKRPTFAHCFPV